MIVTEKNVEDYLKGKVEAAGGMYIKIPAVYATGIPDRLILMPKGRVAFAEIKRPRGGRIAPIQKWWQEKLRSLGFIAEVVKNYDEADELVRRLTDEMDNSCRYARDSDVQVYRVDSR